MSEVLTDMKALKDIKVLCNKDDYLSLLSKTGQDSYTLIFLTTYDRGFAQGVPSVDSKYCTAMWPVIEYLREDMQVDGTFDSLPSACSGGSVGMSASSNVGVEYKAFVAALMAAAFA
eukprot:63336_1